MGARDNGHVDGFEEALQTWLDERFVTRKELRALAMFSMYLVNLADADGWSYLGHSYKESEYLGCLVVKAMRGDIRQVVFTSGHTYTSCVDIFLRKMDAGMLEWRDDRF